jgi:hypothetical protein
VENSLHALRNIAVRKIFVRVDASHFFEFRDDSEADDPEALCIPLGGED